METYEWKQILRATIIGVVVLLAPTGTLSVSAMPLQAEANEDLETLYAQAVFEETVEGDLAAALRSYRELIAKAPASSDIEYRARLRMIGVLRRMGDTEAAAEASALLTQRFPERAITTSSERSVDGGASGQAASLIEQLGSPEEAIREQAESELRWFGDLVVPQLEEAIRADNVFCSVHAARTLVGLTGERAAPALARALASDDLIVRRNVLRGMGREPVRSDILFQALVERARVDSDDRIRIDSIDLLSKRGPASLAEHAIEIFEAGSESVRAKLADEIADLAAAPAGLIEDLLSRSLTDPSARVRMESHSLAWKLGPERVLSVARRLLEDDDPEVRETALYLGSLLRDHQNLAREAVALVASRATDEDATVRRVALQEFRRAVNSNFGSTQRLKFETIGVLIDGMKALFEGAPVEEQIATLREFASARHPNAQPWILECLAKRELYWDALEYVRRCWQEDWVDVAPVVIAGFENDPMKPQQIAGGTTRTGGYGVSRVTRALSQYPRVANLPLLFDFYDRRIAINPNDELAEDLRKDVIRMFISHGASDMSVDQWRATMARVHPDDLAWVKKTLGHVWKPELVPAYVESTRSGVDRNVLKALGEFASEPGAGEALRAVATDESQNLDMRVEAAAHYLEDSRNLADAMRVAVDLLIAEGRGKTGGLVGLLLQKNPPVSMLRELCRSDTKYCLEVFGRWFSALNRNEEFQVDRDLLMIALESEDADVRAGGMRTIRRVGDESWFPVIVESTNDPNPMVRKEAARALGTLRDVNAMPVLVELLRDREEEVRTAAKASLETIRFYAEQKAWWEQWKATGGAASGVAAVLAMLDDSSQEVRIRAIESLGSIGSPEALPRLLELLKDEDPKIREAASAAIDRINKPQ